MSFYEEKLKELCKEKGARIQGIEHLIEYYEKSLGWSKEKAIGYVLELFGNGTIDSLMVISKKGGSEDASK